MQLSLNTVIFLIISPIYYRFVRSAVVAVDCSLLLSLSGSENLYTRSLYFPVGMGLILTS